MIMLFYLCAWLFETERMHIDGGILASNTSVDQIFFPYFLMYTKSKCDERASERVSAHNDDGNIYHVTLV